MDLLAVGDLIEAGLRGANDKAAAKKRRIEANKCKWFITPDKPRRVKV
jgi:hypothetical protein